MSIDGKETSKKQQKRQNDTRFKNLIRNSDVVIEKEGTGL